jgi:transcriptional regulator with XRE-family HTH domain
VKSTLTAPTPTPDTSFRLFLQSELARRCTRNSQYSLRAFAMHLDVDHSTLSQWLRGRRPMTVRSIESIGQALRLPASTIERYVDQARREPEDTEPASVLTGDTVSAIADWYHFAILELTHLGEFRPDSRWIARVLDVSVDEVNVALQRLIRLGLLDMVARDRWVDTAGDARATLQSLQPETIDARQTSTARLSASASRLVPVTYREQTSITMAISSTSLPRAFEIVSGFRQQLVDLLTEGEPDDVYQFEIALFPVTTLKRERTG